MWQFSCLCVLLPLVISMLATSPDKKELTAYLSVVSLHLVFPGSAKLLASRPSSWPVDTPERVGGPSESAAIGFAEWR